jgi:hypothetical protein
VLSVVAIMTLRPQAHITAQSHYHCIHPAATGQYLHWQIAIMMKLIVVISIIVRSHLGSSVRVASPSPANTCVNPTADLLSALGFVSSIAGRRKQGTRMTATGPLAPFPARDPEAPAASRLPPATGPLDENAHNAWYANAPRPRKPATIEDTRFEKRRGLRETRCGECGDLFRGNEAGAFCHRENMPPVEERAAAWKRGDWDATWYCIGCYMRYYDCSYKTIAEWLGFTERVGQRQMKVFLQYLTGEVPSVVEVDSDTTLAQLKRTVHESEGLGPDVTLSLVLGEKRLQERRS